MRLKPDGAERVQSTELSRPREDGGMKGRRKSSPSYCFKVLHNQFSILKKVWTERDEWKNEGDGWMQDGLKD